MLGYMLATLADASGVEWHIRTAGTHVVEGSAMSVRTRDALVTIEELGAQRYGDHRSHQLNDDDVQWADVILASEADHVRFVRKNFSTHADKAVQLAQFVRSAPLGASLAQQLATLSHVEPSPAFDVADPAGADQATYERCARQLWELSQVFATLVTELQIL
jgi:protein-tyrosine-phosphatase